MLNSKVSLNIQQLKNSLEAYPSEALVVYDFGGSPHIRHAFKNEVAFSVSETNPAYRDNTVGGLCLALKCAIGAIISSESNEIIVATESTHVWVAEGDYVQQGNSCFSVWVNDDKAPVRAIIGLEAKDEHTVMLNTSSVDS